MTKVIEAQRASEDALESYQIAYAELENIKLALSRAKEKCEAEYKKYEAARNAYAKALKEEESKNGKRYSVLTYSFSGWHNVWTIEGDNKSVPETFATIAEAEKAIADAIRDTDAAIESGEIDPDAREVRDDFRIAKVVGGVEIMLDGAAMAIELIKEDNKKKEGKNVKS